MNCTKISFSLILLAASLFSSVPTSAQHLDPVLWDLIQKGLNKSHQVTIKHIEAEQAQVDQQLAKSIFLPKITLNGSYTRLNDDITFDEDTQTLLTATQKLLVKEAMGLPFNATFPEQVPLQDVPSLQNKNILKSSVDLDWILFSGLEARHALRASQHKETSLNYLGLAEEEKVALQIIEVYDQLALVTASKKVLTTTETYLKEQVHYVKSAIKNGLVTPISRKRIELAQQQLAAKQLDVEHNNILLIELLHHLTGESRANLLLLNPKLTAPDSNLATTSRKRYEIRALEEAELATSYKAKMERSNFIPKVAVKGHYEFIEDDLSLLDPKWFVGIGVRWHLFDGNQARLKSKKTQLESQKYRDQIRDAEELIDLSIAKAEMTYKASLENSKIVATEVELANDTYEMVNKQYRNNLSTINEVLEALKEVEKANFKLQESYFKQRRAVVELQQAKGLLSY